MVTPDLPGDLSEVIAHLESCYPSEGCGVLIRGGGGWRARPMQNAYDRYKAVDPEQFPRTSRTAYFFDPKELLSVEQEVDRQSERIAVIFHSHADVGAYFSAEDKAMAAPGGEPLFPGVDYLVVAVDAGRATAARIFSWNDGTFDEAPVPIPKRST